MIITKNTTTMTEYTFEDWLEGRSINWTKIYLKQDEKLTPDQIATRKQIGKAQKKAWSWLVKLNTEYWIEELKNESEGYIEAFKKEKKKFFEDNLELVKRYEKGQIEGIDHKMYKRLKVLFEKHHEKGGYNIGVTLHKDGKGYPGRLQDVYVFKNVLQHLEKKPDPKSNEFRRGLEKMAEQNEEKRIKFILLANEFMSKKIKTGKNRSDFISRKGWPKVTLYRDPFRSSDIPESTRKDWLKKAIEKGEI